MKTYRCGTPRELQEGEGDAYEAEGFSQAAHHYAVDEANRGAAVRRFLVTDGNETFEFYTMARKVIEVSVFWVYPGRTQL